MIWKLIAIVLAAVFLVALMNFVVTGNFLFLALGILAAAAAVNFWNISSRKP